MNEQNNINANPQPAGAENTTPPVEQNTAPVSNPTQEQVQSEPVSVAQSETPQPTNVAQPVQGNTAGPATQPQAIQAQPQVVMPADPTEVAQQPQPVPVATDAAPVPVAQPVNPQPVPVQQPVAVTQEQVQPQTNIVNTDIPNNVGTTLNNGMFGPSGSFGGGNDATNIGFVAASSDFKKKKNVPLIVTIVVVILGILGALGYFVVFPYIQKKYFDKPINVYETSIKNLFNGISSSTDTLMHTKAIYNLEASFDTNIESLKEYSGYSYALNLGVDPDKKTLQEGLTIKELSTDKESSFFSYLKDNQIYESYSSNRNYIYVGEATNEQIKNIFSQFNISNDMLFDTSNKLNNEDMKYLTTKMAEILIGSIDQSKLSKEDASIDFNGETIKVTNNKYEMNQETIIKMANSIKDSVIGDDKTIEILAKSIGIEKDKLIESIKGIEIKESEDADKDYSIIFSIYTYGKKNDIIGFAVNTSDKKLHFHYYTKKDTFFEIVLETEYTDEVTDKKDNTNIRMVGKKDGSVMKVSVTMKDTEIATLEVRQWNEKGIDFDYNVKYEEYNYTGSLKLNKDVNNDRAKYDLEFSLKTGSEFINFILKFSVDWSSEVANINTDTAETKTEAEREQLQQQFKNEFAKTPIGKLLATEGGDTDPSIDDYYNNNPTPDIPDVPDA